MKQKIGNKSEHGKKKSKKDKKKYRKQRKHSESNSSSDSNESEQEWVEKPISKPVSMEQEVSTSSLKEESHKREDWMNMKSMFPCVFNEKKSTSTIKDNDKLDLDKLGQSDKELNPYWKNNGNGLPGINTIKTDVVEIMDANWLKKSLQRAQEQAENEGKSLEEIAADRWGSLEVIQSMIAKAERISRRNKSKKIVDESKRDKHFRSRSRSQNRHKEYRKHDSSQYERQQKQEYKKPTDNTGFINTSYKTHCSGRKRWQKDKKIDKSEENQSDLNTFELRTVNAESNKNTNDIESDEIKPITEAEMNKLGAKIVKAEIMGNTELAAKLKIQLQKARELATNTIQLHEMGKVENVILAQTNKKSITEFLEPKNHTKSLERTKYKNLETHIFGNKFQYEKGRSSNADDTIFVKAASKDMDDIPENENTRVQSNTKQYNIDNLLAIKEYNKLSKSLDNCHWCIDTKYMLKHMIVAMDSEVCLSLPHYTSLTDGHCILTPIQHVACQLQLDDNVWEKLKVFKRILYKMFVDQNQYPVFYEIYKNHHKFSHMQLECVPLSKEIGELAPLYFKKALLECETEWSMNKQVIELEGKNIRRVIPKGLSYFMVEFELNKGYAHVIEDDRLFPKNFAEEIIGGMLDLDHDIWRKKKNENFEQQRDKVLKFSKIWRKYDFEIMAHV